MIQKLKGAYESENKVTKSALDKIEKYCKKYPERVDLYTISLFLVVVGRMSDQILELQKK